jgi:hypothetical protein
MPFGVGPTCHARGDTGNHSRRGTACDPGLGPTRKTRWWGLHALPGAAPHAMLLYRPATPALRRRVSRALCSPGLELLAVELDCGLAGSAGLMAGAWGRLETIGFTLGEVAVGMTVTALGGAAGFKTICSAAKHHPIFIAYSPFAWKAQPPLPFLPWVPPYPPLSLSFLPCDVNARVGGGCLKGRGEERKGERAHECKCAPAR